MYVSHKFNCHGGRNQVNFQSSVTTKTVKISRFERNNSLVAS